MKIEQEMAGPIGSIQCRSANQRRFTDWMQSDLHNCCHLLEKSAPWYTESCLAGEKYA